jgi:DNA-binding winged helix-turn-helix (wHTH) protein
MSDPPSGTSRLVRFGVFEIDLRSGDLRKGGTRLNLPEQPLQVLTALLERPGDLVTRDELRQRLWPGDTFVDFEHGLNAAVRRLRDTLGDSADVPRFVETVPRRGYRFVAPVARDSGAPADNSQTVSNVVPSPPLVDPQPHRRRWWIGGGVMTAVCVMALAAWLFRAGSLQTTAAPPMRVVPLTTLPGDE